jgi:Lrp/AsnC family transcriptional regulator, leucine-responsive regulatory protein
MQNQKNYQLDQINSKLLKELQEDGRLTFAELGRRVCLTTPAVIERIRRMEDLGIIIGYRAEVDPAKIGLTITAFIMLSVRRGPIDQVTKAIRNSSEILECHRITGGDSFIIRTAVTSVEHLESLIDRLTPYGTTSTCVVLSSPLLRRILHMAETSTQQRRRSRQRRT